MMTETMIEKLTEKGFSRWTKGAMDRLYINANDLGLYTDSYKSGNICFASFNGEEISHAHALRMIGAKIWIDVETGLLNSKYAEDCLVEAAKAIYEQVKAEIATEEAAAQEAAAEESDVQEVTAEEAATTESASSTSLPLPTITGTSDKQIKYASDLRAFYLARHGDEVSRYMNVIDDIQSREALRAQVVARRKAEGKKCYNICYDDAKPRMMLEAGAGTIYFLTTATSASDIIAHLS